MIIRISDAIQISTFNKFVIRQSLYNDRFRLQLVKFFSLIMHVNSFIKINNKNFNEIFLSTIKKSFKKVAEIISRNKNDANSNVHELLFYKQKDRIRFNAKIQDR